MTLVESLRQGEALLRSGPHPERAPADAEILLRHVLGKNRAWVLTHDGDELSTSDADLYAKLVERRAQGEPIQYILGEQEFYGLSFLVTPEVLIPRSETEHLVEKAIELVPLLNGFVTGHDFSSAETTAKQAGASTTADSRSLRILDVGTGSGAIAIALAHELPQAQITAVDISAQALDIAHRNAAHNGLADRIRFLESDLLSAVANERFEMIVSNPPYVPLADRESLFVEVRDHEPALALFAGDDGLDIYRRLIPEAFVVLEPGGFLLMEIGYGQAEAVGLLLRQTGFDAIEFIPDLQGIPRVACGRRPR